MGMGVNTNIGAGVPGMDPSATPITPTGDHQPGQSQGLGQGLGQGPGQGSGSLEGQAPTGSSQEGGLTLAGGAALPHDFAQLFPIMMAMLGNGDVEAALQEYQAGTDAGMDAWAGMDAMVQFIAGSVDYGVEKLNMRSNGVDPASRSLVDMLRAPQPEAPNASQVDSSLASSDVWKLVAQVLAKLAEQAYKDKVVESGVTQKAEEGKKENRLIDQIQMTKMKAKKDAQIAKTKRLEKHGKAMKVLMITMTAVMAVIAVIVLVVVAVIMVATIVVTGGTATFIWIAVIATVLATAAAVTATVAGAAVNITMTATDAMAPGGFIDRMVEALGLETSEFMRVLVNLVIQLMIGCINIVSTLISAGVTMAAQIATSIVNAVIQFLIMMLISILCTVLGAVVGSGLMDFAVREAGAAMGMDEEWQQRMSMITSVAVMVLMIGLSLAAMGASMVDVSSLGKRAADFGKQINQFLKDNSTRYAQFANQVSDVGQGVADTASTASQSIASAARSAANSGVGRALGNAGKTVGQGATNAAKGIGRGASRAAGAVGKRAGPLAERTGVSKLASRAGNSLKGTTGLQSLNSTQALQKYFQMLTSLMEAGQGITQVLEGIFQMVMGVMTMVQGQLMKDIGELEKEMASIRFIQELVKIMNATLGATIQFGLELMESVTEDAARAMETGNQIWDSLSRAGTAINEGTLA